MQLRLLTSRKLCFKSQALKLNTGPSILSHLRLLLLFSTLVLGYPACLLKRLRLWIGKQQEPLVMSMSVRWRLMRRYLTGRKEDEEEEEEEESDYSDSENVPVVGKYDYCLVK
jgi:hypothetical protein